MSYIGKTPTSVPLTSGDITDGIISTSKIADDAISAAKLASGVGGKVLQQVHATTTTQVSSSSSTLADTTLTAAITPSATSSKILVLATHNGNYVNDSNINNALRINLFRDSTEIGRTGGVGWIEITNDNLSASISFNVVDSPSSTSAVTYKTKFANINGTASVAVQNSFGGDWVTTSYITLIEIGA